MKKFSIGILLALLLSLSSIVSASDLSTTVCPGAGCQVVNVGNSASIGIQITGTWVGTITFQGSVDNSTYVSLLVLPSTSATPVTTATGNGTWLASVSGLSTVRIVFTAYSSGTATVTPRPTQFASRRPAGSAGGGTGTVTSITTSSPITGGPITDSGAIACATCGVTGSPLSQFASTTSAQFLGVISNETGSGLVVGNTSPTLVTPALGSATATGISFAAGNGLSFSGGAPTTIIAGADSSDTIILDNTVDSYLALQFNQYVDFFTTGGIGISADTDAASIFLTGVIQVTANDAVNALTLFTPVNTDVLYDTTPLAAIYINAPSPASTRNFIAGIWVVTNGASVDKGRGIGVQNTGASDSYYAQQDAANSCAFCALLNEANFGISIVTTNANAIGARLVGGNNLDSPKFQLAADNNDDATDLWQFDILASTNAYRMVNNGNVLFSILPSGNLTITGTTPAVTDTTANSCGTGTQTIVGNDNAGKVTVIGSVGTSCTVTFATAYTNAPSCTVTNETTAALVRATSTTSTTILAGTFAQNDVLAYICIGR